MLAENVLELRANINRAFAELSDSANSIFLFGVLNSRGFVFYFSLFLWFVFSWFFRHSEFEMEYL